MQSSLQLRPSSARCRAPVASRRPEALRQCAQAGRADCRAGAGFQPASRRLQGSRQVVKSRPAVLACRAAAIAAGQAGSQSGATRLFATVLGYCVLVGSLFRSVPQIVKIVQSESVEGLSLTSFVVELVTYSVIWAYNLNNGYPFSTYGDIVACWVQDVILIFLVLRLRRMIDAKALLLTAAFAVFTTVLMLNLCGSQVLAGLQASTILAISFGARLPQILMNARRGDSGQLSLTTCLLNVLGCISRLITTLVLTQDMLNFGGTALQTVLNGVLLHQTVRTARRRGAGPAAGATSA